MAVDVASKAFAGWSQTAPAERARLFLKAAEIVRRRRSEIAEVLARETGSTISFATFQQDLVAATLQQVAGWVFLPKGEVNLIGGVKTARMLAERAGRTLKRTVLELGGFNPMIILDDVDMEYEMRSIWEGGRQRSRARPPLACCQSVCLFDTYFEPTLHSSYTIREFT